MRSRTRDGIPTPTRALSASISFVATATREPTAAMNALSARPRDVELTKFWSRTLRNSMYCGGDNGMMELQVPPGCSPPGRETSP